MRKLGLTLLGFVAGFAVGIVGSEVVGIAGVLIFHREIGFKSLPFVFGVIFAVALPLVDGRIRRSKDTRP